MLLLDEPFSNLDTALRVQVRAEVRRLLAELGVTTVFVTHDQEEAFILGDRVAVMATVASCRSASPPTLPRPVTPWVAGVRRRRQPARRHGDAAGATTPFGPCRCAEPGDGPARVLVRPEELRLASIRRQRDRRARRVLRPRHRLPRATSRPARGAGPRSAAPRWAAGDGVTVAHSGRAACRLAATHARRDATLLVVGAGPAGLVAAWRAAPPATRSRCVERAERVGGHGRQLRGRRGAGRPRQPPPAPVARPALLDDLRALLGDDLQVRPRHGRIRLARPVGRLPAADRRPGRAPRRPFAARAAVDAALAPARRGPRADTFAEVVRAGLGPTVADDFYGPYVRKIWDVDPSELSGELARRRVSAARPSPSSAASCAGAGRRAAPSSTRGAASGRSSSGSPTPRPRGRHHPHRRRRGAPHPPDGAIVRLDDATRSRRAGLVDRAAPRARRPRPAGPEAAVLEAAARLTHRAMVLVYLVLDRPQ